ncbi:uncharacterized protein LOC62_06G007948 [Vanrija pseudolonga]|uniref:Uncharacterized protein n=1 Tax=Vanrija pseudolonga TaxID=143232 RepID=A0AAF0YI88_9TREE|nr:hypothetical protein LOC62_06G007948 [Vanrija pseudolonga]
MPLDLTSFPHLAEAIAAGADRRTLLTLRAVSREFLALADARLLAHIALQPVTPEQWHALGGTVVPREAGLPIASFMSVVSLSAPGPLYPPKLYTNWLDSATDLPILDLETRDLGTFGDRDEKLWAADGPASSLELDERDAWTSRLRHVKVLDVYEGIGQRCIQWWVDTLRALGVELDAVRVTCDNGPQPDSAVFMMARAVPTLPTRTVIALPGPEPPSYAVPAVGFDTIIQWLPWSDREDNLVPYAVLNVDGLYPASFDWKLPSQGGGGYAMAPTRHAVLIMTLVHPLPCENDPECCDGGGAAWWDVGMTIARVLFHGARCTLVDLDKVSTTWFRDEGTEDDVRLAEDRLRQTVEHCLTGGDHGLEKHGEPVSDGEARHMVERLEFLTGWEYAQTLSPAVRGAVWEGVCPVPTA